MKLTTAFLKTWIEPWRSYVSEFLGTFVFVFIVSLIPVVKSLYGSVDNLEISFIVAFSYTAIIYSTVNISGGFLNPVVVLALWMCQKMVGFRAVFYIISQLIGGLLGFALVDLVFYNQIRDFVFLELGLGVRMETALVLEAIFTAILVYVIFSTIIDKKASFGFGPLVVGLSQFCATALLLPITGGILNPARVIGPALFLADYSLVSVFVLGPVVGSLFAIVYEFAFLRSARRK